MAKLARWTEDDLQPREKYGLLPERRPARDNMYAVAADVTCFQLSIVNVAFVGTPGAGDREWVLVDTGLYTSGEAIRRAAGELFAPGSRPAAILLTHGHFDHVGAVRELADRWNAPIYAHELELPYLTGLSAYPPPDPTVGGGLMSRLSPLYPKAAIDLQPRVRPLPADHSVPGMPGWRWLPTPGHSPGHVSFFRDADRVLIAGDAFVTTKQESLVAALTQPPAVHGPPAYFTPDWESAGRSVRDLAALRPEAALTGHGRPMSGDRLRSALDRLAADFDRLAVPPHGRYVGRPAVTDERGVVSVPPPVSDPVPALLAGAAAMAGLALLFRGHRR